jgi:hypothetical protein
LPIIRPRIPKIRAKNYPGSLMGDATQISLLPSNEKIYVFKRFFDFLIFFERKFNPETKRKSA